MKRRMTALLLALMMVLACAAAQAELTEYADILRSVDYGKETTYVVGHKSPDADTIGSAMAYAYLLRELGIDAQAVASAKVNQETQYALDSFGLEQPEILSNAEGKQFILVDHSEYSQALDGMRNARVVGIVDHHGIGDIRNTERICVRSLPAGATASIVYQSYVECGVAIPADMACVMLMSIISDTRGMTSNVTEMDRKAYEALLPISGIGDMDALYAGMRAAKMAYDEMTASEIFYDDYKDYLAGEYTFGIGVVITDTEENLAAMTRKMAAAMPAIYASGYLDLMLCMICSDDATCLVWYGEDAEAIIRESFPDYDGSGSLAFRPGVSRKTVIVPALTQTLERWTEAGRAAAEGAEE